VRRCCIFQGWRSSDDLVARAVALAVQAASRRGTNNIHEPSVQDVQLAALSF
jgi:hypothetical protein